MDTQTRAVYFTRSYTIDHNDNPAAKPAKTHAQVAPIGKKRGRRVNCHGRFGSNSEKVKK